jgi:hypothetical protein
MSELFAAGHEDHEPGSPKKKHVAPVMAPKGTSNQKYAPSRLFNDNEEDESVPAKYKSNPGKYDHFDIGEEYEDDPLQHRRGPQKPKAAIPMRPQTNKNQSSWDFQDFETPAKIPQRIRGQDVVHFSIDNHSSSPETPAARPNKPRRDNEAHFELQDDGSNFERHAVPKPRKDTETHFQLKDTASPAADRTLGDATNASHGRNGSYRSQVNEADEDARPLSNITNNAARKNTFNSHFSMSEDSAPTRRPNNENGKKTLHQKGLESHWSMGQDDLTPKGGEKAQNNYWDF